MVNIADILVENCVGSYLKLGKECQTDINNIHDGIDNYRFDEYNKKLLTGIDIKYIIYFSTLILNLLGNFKSQLQLIKPNEVLNDYNYYI